MSVVPARLASSSITDVGPRDAGFVLVPALACSARSRIRGSSRPGASRSPASRLAGPGLLRPSAPPLLAALLAIAAPTALTACGDDEARVDPDGGVGVDASDEPDGGIDEDGCRILSLGPRDFQFNFFGQLTGLRYPVAPELDGASADVLLIELYDSFSTGLPPLVAGSFDLSAAPDDDLATCQHCVWLIVDEDPDAPLGAIYYQTEGTLTLDEVSDPLDPVVAGSTSRVVLRRASVTEDGHSVLEPEGDCVSITGASFDTAPTPGQACLSAEDCGNALVEICAPGDNVCTAPQCGDFFSCPEDGQVCLSQFHDLFDGACYASCDPTAAPGGPCGRAQRCVQFGVDPSFGLCRDVGDAAVGAPCEIEDNSTSCAGDAVCSRETATCSPTCAYFEAVTGCTGDDYCSLFGVCEPPTGGVDVEVGSVCPGDVELATGCAADGEAFRGICFAYEPEAPLICEEACLGELGCEDGEFCALRFTSGLGICRPLPVCGDGEYGEINEVCDDGNTESGDGCSGDCQTVEYEIICAGLPALPIGPEVDGDTAPGIDGFQASCQVGIARAELFTVTPPGAGRLRLHLASPTDQTVSLRSDCADASSELSCVEQALEDGGKELVFQVTDPTPAPLVAMVSAFTVLEEGPFTVSADFVAENCGDAIIAGNEVCDDGNTDSDDGCRGDCLEIEYDFYCAEAELLSTSAANLGDTTGGPLLLDNTCTTEAGGEATGPDHLYRYVAPDEGTLHLHLEGDFFLTLVVFDGCGAPSAITELGCAPIFIGGELDIPLAAGQSITVVVDGFLNDSQGAYSLEAMFTAS